MHTCAHEDMHNRPCKPAPATSTVTSYNVQMTIDTARTRDANPWGRWIVPTWSVLPEVEVVRGGA